MEVEQFDLVNEHDEVIGTTTKAESHANGAIHRCVAVYVFTPDGHLYVQEHGEDKKLDHSVGGHVRKGEAYAIAAIRESLEEVGLEDPLTFVANFYSDEGDRRHMFGLYECYPSSEWTFTPNDEVQVIYPMPIAQIVAEMNASPEKIYRRL